MNDKVKVDFREKGKNKGLVFFCDFMIKRGMYSVEWLSVRSFATPSNLWDLTLIPINYWYPKICHRSCFSLTDLSYKPSGAISESLIQYSILFYSILLKT